MGRSDTHFAEFGDHTRLKHLVLDSYLHAWARVVLVKGTHSHAWFIDAFAGEGRDSHGQAGSPLIACQVSRTIDRDLGKNSDGSSKLQVLAIEKDKKRCAVLADSTRECTKDRILEVLCGTLGDQLELVFGRGHESDPRLFFLDPFGIKGLDAAIVRRIMSKDRCEVLLLFNDAGAIRLHGAAGASAINRIDTRTESVALSLFDNLETTKNTPQDHSGLGTAPAADAILRTAFGDSDYEIASTNVSRIEVSQRRRQWLIEYVAAIKRWGAQFVVNFSVVDDELKHHYYLVHVSNHRSAILKMKEAINTAQIKREKSHEQRSLFYQSTVDVTAVVDDIHRAFAGKMVRWQDNSDQSTVKSFVVERTDALMSDMPAIKEELVHRGWLLSKKPAIYQIPNLLTSNG